MYSQPFCVSENRILVCICDWAVRAIDMQAPSFPIALFSLPGETPAMYYGVAMSESTGIVCIAERFQCGLILADLSLLFVRLIELSGSIELPGSLSPMSIARARNRFWFAVHEGDFATRLGRLDEITGSVAFLETSDGWEEPPALNMIGWPIVLAHHGNLALFNAFVNMLYWLDGNGGVQRTLKIPPKAILGPSLSGDLVALWPTDTGMTIATIDRSASLVPLAEIRDKPWTEAEGICQWRDRVLILDHENCIHSYSVANARWSLVGEPE